MKKIVISCTWLALFACQSQNLSEWPDSIPGQQVFIDAYSSDLVNQQRQSRQEYLQWIMSFYQGSLVAPNGWLDVQATVLTNAAPIDRNRLDSQLRNLGTVIATEWAKSNEIRSIDSRMLALWGSILRLASDPRQQQRSIEVIGEDVDRLLSGSISETDIADARYERLLDLELFGDF